MYCENCGKKLEAGEICSCQKPPEKKKKKNKIRINIYMLISLFLFIFGVEIFLYFYIGAENFLELIPITFVKSNEWNFSCGILILIFSGGIISGILAIRDNTAKKASIIILVLNLVYLLTACGVLGKNIYQNYKTDNFVVNETTEDAAKIADSTLENEQKAVSETNAANENTEFIQTVLAQADEFVQQGNIDKARNVLSDAYAVTNSEEIKRKLDELDGQGTSEQTETLSGETFSDSKDTGNESEDQTEDTGIHRYDFFLSDGTWEDAYRGCKERGGHLVTFESQEEFLYVCSLLAENSQKDNIFFIGGRRDLDSQNYYWVDQNNNLTGSVLNAPDTWNSGYWMSNEPSFKDPSLGIDEHVLSIFFHTGSNQWVWNDEPNDLASAVPSYRGKIGYICEYKN